MKLQPIKLSEAYESENNPRGNDFKGPSFDDLVASVKEKGVLTAVIARPRKKGTKLYEIVAGNRRFRAAQVAGLKEIPANIEDYTDEQAREVQIIENLQREDVHPLEEGQAYRKLVEESHYEVPTIAAKVGKSESYVRQRIFLTRLEAAVQKAYREGVKVQDGHAILIAKLSPIDQISALKHIKDNWRTYTVNELKQFIESEFYHPLEHQPWLNDAKATAAVGPCKECPPNVPALFGAVKEGACTDKKCWRRKMARYISWKKEQNPDLVLISKQYHYMNEGATGKILYSNQYEKIGPKNKCQHSVMGLVASGEGAGSQIRICIAEECKIHSRRHSAAAVTPQQKAKLEKERAAEKARQERAKKKEHDEMAAALEKVKWPLSGKVLDVLLEMCLGDFDNNIDEIGERRFPELAAKEDNDPNWEEEIAKAAEKMSDREKLQLLVEVVLMNQWDGERKKFMKKL